MDQLSRPRQAALAAVTGLVSTLWIWDVATGEDASAGRSIIVVIGILAALVLGLYMVGRRASPNGSAPGPLPLSRRMRRLLTFLVVLDVLALTLVLVPLVLGAPFLAALPLLLIDFLMIAATWLVWWQARSRPKSQQLQRLPRNAGMAVVAELAVYIPSLPIAALIYQALDASTVVALLGTFIFNTAVGWVLLLLGQRITATHRS